MHLALDLDLVAGGRLPLFWCLIAFLRTFLVTRTIVRYIRRHADSNAPRKWWQPRNIGHGTLHIHHVVVGVILVMISGVTMVTLAADGGIPELTAAAILFVISVALVLDEFALILQLEDVYSAEDGRTSVDAVFAAVAVAALLIMGFNPLSFFDIGIWRDDYSVAVRASVVAIAVSTLALAVIVLLKGKVWTGLGGTFITPLLVVGAVRLSRLARAVGPVALHRPAPQDAPPAGTGVVHSPSSGPVKLWLQDAVSGIAAVPRRQARQPRTQP